MMKKFAMLLSLFGVVLAFPDHALAQPVFSFKTWVSNIGLDSNSCSLASPCATFAGALKKTAPGGEIGVLNSGEYGQVIIDRSISIVAQGVDASISTPLGSGVLIFAGDTDVVHLRGLTIYGDANTGNIGVEFARGETLP